MLSFDNTGLYNAIDDAADTLRFACVDPDATDAADTLRFAPVDPDAVDTLRFACVDPDATSIYDLRAAPRATRYVGHSRDAVRRRLIRTLRQDIAGLREAIASGWDVGPELAHEERRLAALLRKS